MTILKIVDVRVAHLNALHKNVALTKALDQPNLRNDCAHVMSLFLLTDDISVYRSGETLGEKRKH